MRKLKLSIIAIVVLTSTTVLAGVKESVEWIVSNSTYKYDGQPLPAVVRLSERQWRKIIANNTMVATFMPSPPTILLRGDQPENVLIHEAVHYLQFIRGDFDNPYFCVGELEPDAYLIESKWLKEHGLPMTGMPDPLWIMVMASRCHSPHRFGIQ